MTQGDEGAAVVGPGKTLAIVLCAGQGSRMGATQNKIFLPLVGVPVGARAIAAFCDSPLVDELIVIVQRDERERVQSELLAPYALTKVSQIVAGGATRHQSERRALEAVRERITSGEIAVVMIHDGARPLVSGAEIARVVEAVRGLPQPGGALLATPIAADERIASVAADAVVEQVFAAGALARAQTPQGFEARTLLEAYNRAERDGFEGTDTASVVEAAGGLVVIVPGDEANLKVTTPDDLLHAEAILRMRDQEAR
ncbi:MAG: 2-C-methyl-D-erythritol 4-phosphate cytidylyltransferase [Ktedonobacterales bacterium]